MPFQTSGVSSTHTYSGNSEINFFLNDEDGLTVTIETERLYIKSVTDSKQDLDSYVSLYGDSRVMEKFGTGETETREEMETHIKNVWAKRWEQKDPYSALVVRTQDTDEFVGNAILGHGDFPGESEFAHLYKENHWDKGFGSEVAMAVVREYAPATVKEGYTLEGKPLRSISSTVRLDNLASIKILKKAGMTKTKEKQIYGAPRAYYSINLSKIPKWMK